MVLQEWNHAQKCQYILHCIGAGIKKLNFARGSRIRAGLYKTCSLLTVHAHGFRVKLLPALLHSVVQGDRWTSTVLCSPGQRFLPVPLPPLFPTGACTRWELLPADNYTSAICEQCWETYWRAERLIIIRGVVIEKTRVWVGWRQL